MTIDELLDEVEANLDPVWRLVALREIRDVVPRISELRRASVIALRDDGWTWPEIATVLGTSPQNAQKLTTKE